MGIITGVQWTDVTWNIAQGCNKVDEDCKYCYMFRNSLGGTRFNPRLVVRTKTVFNLPLKLKVPSKIFTCSHTDFFHEAIDSYRHEAWDIIRRCPQHTFQILTKRPERITAHLPADWGAGWPHVWLGTSVGSHSKKGMQRIRDLTQVTCHTRFLSLEPLHGDPMLNLGQRWCFNEGYHAQECDTLADHIHWVIVGGESGNENGQYRYRPCELPWILNIVTDCQRHSIPVFVKQLGTSLAKQMRMSDRHGSNINEFPARLQVRKFPARTLVAQHQLS